MTTVIWLKFYPNYCRFTEGNFKAPISQYSDCHIWYNKKNVLILFILRLEPAGTSAPILSDDDKFKKKFVKESYHNTMICSAQSNPVPAARYKN